MGNRQDLTRGYGHELRVKSKEPSDFRSLDRRPYGGAYAGRGKGKRMRADVARPGPAGIVTPWRRYLDEAVKRFGAARVGKWGKVTYRFPTDNIIEIKCNGVLFHALRLRSTLALFRGGRVENGKLRDAGAVHVTNSLAILERTVIRLSPEVPEAGWSFDEWFGGQIEGLAS